MTLDEPNGGAGINFNCAVNYDLPTCWKSLTILNETICVIFRHVMHYAIKKSVIIEVFDAQSSRNSIVAYNYCSAGIQ